MEVTKVEASSRSDRGKGPAGRLRASGRIPAVAYGRGVEAKALTVSPGSVREILESEFGRNTLIELMVDEKERLTVLLGEYQYHPVSRELLHADFRTVSLDHPITVDVPFELVGRSKGVVMGGTLRQVFRKLRVRCLPGKIPAKLSHNVSELDLDQHVQVKDLEVPEGVEVALPPLQTVAAVVTEKHRGADAEDEEAKPAEGAAAPAEKKAEGEADKK